MDIEDAQRESRSVYIGGWRMLSGFESVGLPFASFL
jgi:hypothetical protein